MAQHTNRHHTGRREWPAALLFLSPTLVIFGVFVLFPVVFSFYLSFQKWNMFSSGATFVGLDNYAQIIRNPEFWTVLKNTFVYTVGTVPLNMVLSLIIAFFLNKKLAGKKILRTAFFTPVIMSSVAAAVIWRWVYEPNFGLLNTVLGWFGVPAINWLNDPTAAMFALIVMGVWKTFGVNMVLFSAGLQGDPRPLLRSGRDRPGDIMAEVHAHRPAGHHAGLEGADHHVHALGGEYLRHHLAADTRGSG